MAKTAVLSKWGNAQGIRIPEAFCRQLGISVGDEVSLTIIKDRLVMESSAEKYTLKARMKAWDGKGASDREYDYGQPAGKEIW